MTRPVYPLPVNNTAIASWTKVEGTKQLFWPGIILLWVITFIDFKIQHFVNAGQLSINFATAGVAIIFIVNLLISAGLIHMGILRAKGETLQWHSLFYAFNLNVILHLIGLIIVQGLLVMLPSVMIFFSMELMTKHNFYLSLLGGGAIVIATLFYFIIIVRTLFSVAFVLDKSENPFKAIMHSIQCSYGNFWRVIGFVYMSIVFIAAGVLTCLIGFVWILPFLYIWYGSVYLELSRKNIG